jgi:hypothetical protein
MKVRAARKTRKGNFRLMVCLPLLAAAVASCGDQSSGFITDSASSNTLNEPLPSPEEGPEQDLEATSEPGDADVLADTLVQLENEEAKVNDASAQDELDTPSLSEARSNPQSERPDGLTGAGSAAEMPDTPVTDVVDVTNVNNVNNVTDVTDVTDVNNVTVEAELGSLGLPSTETNIESLKNTVEEICATRPRIKKNIGLKFDSTQGKQCALWKHPNISKAGHKIGGITSQSPVITSGNNEPGSLPKGAVLCSSSIHAKGLSKNKLDITSRYC